MTHWHFGIFTFGRSTHHLKDTNVILGLLCYAMLLLCAIIIAAMIWNSFANGTLYRCADPVFDLWPPFVHEGSDDVYLLPKKMVLAVWGGFVLGVFALPTLVLWGICRFTRERK